MSEIDELKEFIENITEFIDRRISKSNAIVPKKAVIVSLNGDRTANIRMNGEVYNNVEILAGLNPQVNEVVSLFLSNGDMRDAYISKCSNTL